MYKVQLSIKMTLYEHIILYYYGNIFKCAVVDGRSGQHVHMSEHSTFDKKRGTTENTSNHSDHNSFQLNTGDFMVDILNAVFWV